MSRPPVSLRWRVTLAATLLGVLLSLLFAGMTIYVSEEYEDTLVGELLQGQAQDYSLRLALDPATPLPQSHRLSGYLRRKDGSGRVPAELAPLAPGFYDDDPRLPAGIHVGVYDIAQGRLFFAIDLSDIEATEQLLAWTVVATFLIGTTFSAWLGWFLAGASLAPVRRLAANVDALPDAPLRTTLAKAAGDDELGRLATAIDHYHDRLVDADGKERQFFADASHELRTPIAVVRGVTEVVLDQPTTDDAMRQRLARLDRGMGELTQLLDVLLGLARRQTPVFEHVDPVALVDEVLVNLSALEGIDQLQVDRLAAPMESLPRREAQQVLEGVLRRLLSPRAAGVLRVRRDPVGLVLHFAAVHVAGNGAATHERGDVGLALTLVGRLAESIGWRIEDVATTDGSREVRLRFPTGTATR